MTSFRPPHKLLLLSLLTLICQLALAQPTKIRGKVIDADTGEPLPMVSVTVQGTTIGTTTDFDGLYSLETREQITELTALFLAYETQTKPVVPGSFNNIDFELRSVTTDLATIVVKPGEDPAYGVLRNVYRNKKYNNPEEKESYAYTSYTKMELDVANVGTEFKGKRMQRNFGFVFEYVDTSAMTGNTYLPVMITESLADYYYRKSPKMGREVVKASRMSGIEEDFNFAQFTGQMYVKVNLYDNYVNFFEVEFASPLSDHGPLFYKFFLVDSTKTDRGKLYKIRFHPRNRATPVFDGEINIDSATWALVSANMRIPKGLNLNWVRDLMIEQKCELLNDSTWFPVQDRMIADFSLTMNESSKMISFMASRQIDYSDIRINEPVPAEVLALKTNIVLDADKVLHNDEQYWVGVRPYELSEKERNIYIMVDSIKEAPLFNNIYNAINTAIVGYYKPRKFPFLEYGPYYKLFSFNKLEGARFQMGARTTKDFSEKIRLTGYGAYSTNDSKWKGGGSVEYMFSKIPTSKLTLSAKHDLVQLGARQNAFASANLLSSIFSRGGNEKLTLINQFDVAYEKEWTENFSNAVSFQFRQMHPTRYVDFLRPDSTEYGKINSSEIKLGARFSKNEIIYRRPFEKISTMSVWPVLSLDLTFAPKDFLRNDYDYMRLELSIDHTFNIAPLGRSSVIVSGGKIFGKVPFPLLKLHEGNSTYFYDKMTFSCMDFYEFASDMWGQVVWEHHFKGFFLSRIPLLKKLQWREVFTAKALWGSLTDRNNGSLPADQTEAPLLFPQGMSSVSKPYVEVGFGIENIFRLFRVDTVWRVTHRTGYEGKKVDNFSVNFSMRIDF